MKGRAADKKRKKSKITNMARKKLLADRMHGAGQADLTKSEPASMDFKGAGAKLYGVG